MFSFEFFIIVFIVIVIYYYKENQKNTSSSDNEEIRERLESKIKSKYYNPVIKLDDKSQKFFDYIGLDVNKISYNLIELYSPFGAQYSHDLFIKVEEEMLEQGKLVSVHNLKLNKLYLGLFEEVSIRFIKHQDYEKDFSPFYCVLKTISNDQLNRTALLNLIENVSKILGNPTRFGEDKNNQEYEDIILSTDDIRNENDIKQLNLDWKYSLKLNELDNTVYLSYDYDSDCFQFNISLIS